MQYWLMKSEPDVFSIQDLKKKKVNGWDGVRNYQARNFMREMKRGDLAFFYHSSCEVPGIYGLMRVAVEAHPDPTQFDKKSDYYDPKATKAKPIWFMPDMEFVEEFKAPITLEMLRNEVDLGLITLRKGNRLSVTPVSESDWKKVLKIRGDSRA